jgi:phospholipase C
MPHADVTVNRSAYTVTATMSNTGTVGASMFVVTDKYQTAAAAPFTVVNGTNKTYTWTAASKNSYGYAFSIYGPDGFVRSFAGAIVAASTTTGQIPGVTATPAAGSGLQLTLANAGTTSVTYTLTVNDYAGTTQTVTVGANGSSSVTWPVDSDGYYDVIITANTTDGFTRRYAGRIS